jgi:hypothetical protein
MRLIRSFVLYVALLFLFASNAFAGDFVIWNSTQIERDGNSYQIEGVKPSEKNLEGMAWLADTASLKASARPKGSEFVAVGCSEVLLKRYLCKDLKFADNTSVLGSWLWITEIGV